MLAGVVTAAAAPDRSRADDSLPSGLMVGLGVRRGCCVGGKGVRYDAALLDSSATRLDF